MQVSVESTSALERRMTIGVPVERIETEVNKRLQQTASRAKIPGFRPGKVPMSVIRQRYEAAARQEALGDLIQATFYEAVVAEKLNPAGAPAVEPKVFEKGKDLEYVATFEVFPELKVAGFEGIEVERLQAEVKDADVDNMLDILRKQNTRFEKAERAAEDGDQLNIDFVGKIDGEAFAGGSAKGTQLFRAEVKKNMERELRQAIKTKVKNQVMEGLVSSNPIEVPKALIDNEVNRLRVQAVQQFGGNIKPDQLPAELFEEQAKRRVVLGLIVAEVVKQYELKPDDARVRELIEEMASAYQEPEQVVSWYYKNDEQLNEVRSVVLEEQVVDTVLQQAKVTDKSVSYEEAVKPAEAPQAA